MFLPARGPLGLLHAGPQPLVLPLLLATGHTVLRLSLPQYCCLDFSLLPTSLEILASKLQASCPLHLLSSQGRKEGRKERARGLLSAACAPGTALPQAGTTLAPLLAQSGPALRALTLPCPWEPHSLLGLAACPEECERTPALTRTCARSHRQAHASAHAHAQPCRHHTRTCVHMLKQHLTMLFSQVLITTLGPAGRHLPYESVTKT